MIRSGLKATQDRREGGLGDDGYSGQRSWFHSLQDTLYENAGEFGLRRDMGCAIESKNL